jgi:flavin-binding protein dodecin
VVRVAEATGESARGWEPAVVAAIKASDVKDPLGVEVVRMWAAWDGRKLSRFHVTVKVAYRQALKAALKPK